VSQLFVSFLLQDSVGSASCIQNNEKMIDQFCIRKDMEVVVASWWLNTIVGSLMKGLRDSFTESVSEKDSLHMCLPSDYYRLAHESVPDVCGSLSWRM
jgi:hypothetical protein